MLSDGVPFVSTASQSSYSFWCCFDADAGLLANLFIAAIGNAGGLGGGGLFGRLLPATLPGRLRVPSLGCRIEPNAGRLARFLTARSVEAGSRMLCVRLMDVRSGDAAGTGETTGSIVRSVLEMGDDICMFFILSLSMVAFGRASAACCSFRMRNEAKRRRVLSFAFFSFMCGGSGRAWDDPLMP